MSDPKRLIDKILAEAKQKAEQEATYAQQKAGEVVNKAKQKAKGNAEKARLAALEEAVERKRRVKSVYDLEHKKDILTMKRDVLDDVFDKAVDDIAALDDARYLKLMTRLLVECADTGEGGIKIAESDQKRLGPDFIDSANEALKKAAGKGEVQRLKETCDRKGGFIYVNGGMEIDCSIEAVVALARERIETDAAARLFKAEA